jgi:hypothetical protein
MVVLVYLSYSYRWICSSALVTELVTSSILYGDKGLYRTNKRYAGVVWIQLKILRVISNYRTEMKIRLQRTHVITVTPFFKAPNIRKKPPLFSGFFAMFS